MNQIFAHLPSIARELIEPHVETVSLRAQKVLHRAGAPIYFVYFPNVGLVAIMIVTRDGRTVTTSLVGRDGMVSSGASLNAKTSLDEATVQVAGDAIRIPGRIFMETYDASEEFRNLVNRYHGLMFAQAQQSAACNALHAAPQRLCRWLAEAMDRMGARDLTMTHDFLAGMLGVRRTTVSEDCYALKREGVVSYNRGNFKILKPAELRLRACECYDLLRQRSRKVFPEWASLKGP